MCQNRGGNITIFRFGLSCLKNLAFLLAVVMLQILSGCSSNGDEPSVPKYGSAPVVVSFSINPEMVFYQDVNLEESRAGAGMDLRCQVRAYAESSNGQLSARPVADTLLILPAKGPQQGRCKFTLPSGRYRVMAWADYVDAGSKADKYYTTTDFSDIRLNGSYVGGTDARNAFAGSAAVNFSVPYGDTTTVVRQDLPLASVMGKIKFVATDYNQWLAGTPQNLRVLVNYPAFLPHRYSVPRGVPFDATTGVSFISTMSELSTDGHGSATLATDYVMVNGDESSVTVALGLYDDTGKLVCSSGTINVPLRRGGLTVVSGHFLTKTANSGGIGIDPDFDGDINIYF